MRPSTLIIPALILAAACVSARAADPAGVWKSNSGSQITIPANPNDFDIIFKGSDGKKGPQPTLMVHTARWAGAACTGGMKPGDMTMPGGVKLNVKQLRKLQDILPKLKVQ